MNAILLSLVCILGTACLVLWYNFYKVNKNFVKLFKDYLVLETYANNIDESKIQEDDGVHKENFIKFISDSRDLAFEYIEEFQMGLRKFVSGIEKEISYFKEYGDVISMSPNYYSMKKITEEYDELVKLLPEEKK